MWMIAHLPRRAARLRASRRPRTTPSRARATGSCCTPSRGACARASPARSCSTPRAARCCTRATSCRGSTSRSRTCARTCSSAPTTASHCPFKGDASYWSVRVGDRVAENAVWTYEDPIAEASWLRGLVSVYPERMDAWLDEDEEVTACATPTTASTRGAARGASRSAPTTRSSRAASGPWSSPRPACRCASTSRARTCSPSCGPARRRLLPVQGPRVVLVAGRGRGRGLVLRGAAGEHARRARHVCFDASKVRSASWRVTDVDRGGCGCSRGWPTSGAPGPIASRPVRGGTGQRRRPGLRRLPRSVDDTGSTRRGTSRTSRPHWRTRRRHPR